MNIDLHSDGGLNLPPSEIEQWMFNAIEDYNDGTIDDRTLRELREMLKSSADARQMLVNHNLMSHLISAEGLGLGHLAKNELIDSMPPSDLPRGSTLKNSKSGRWFAGLKIVSFALLAAALLAGVVGLMFRLQQMDTQSGGLASNDSETPSAVRPGSADPPVAVLQNVTDADWSVGDLAGADGVPLRAGWLQLNSGSAVIRFNSGAVVTLLAASRLKLIDAGSCFLESGDLVATVPAEAIGFRVDTSAMQLTDLGTEFGVSAKRNGETNVQVIKGEVSVEHGNAAHGKEKFNLNEGQASRIQNNGSATGGSVNTELAGKITSSRPAQRIGSYAFDSQQLPGGEWKTSPEARVVGGTDVLFDDFVYHGVVPGSAEYPANLNRWSFKTWRPNYQVENLYVGFKVRSEPGQQLQLNRLSLQLLRGGGNKFPELAPQDGLVRISTDGFKTFHRFILMDKETLVLESKYVSVDLSSVPAAPEYELRFLFRGKSENRAIRLDEVTLDVDVQPTEAKLSIE